MGVPLTQAVGLGFVGCPFGARQPGSWQIASLGLNNLRLVGPPPIRLSRDGLLGLNERGVLGQAWLRPHSASFPIETGTKAVVAGSSTIHFAPKRPDHRNGGEMWEVQPRASKAVKESRL